jgi:hypothetical protein
MTIDRASEDAPLVGLETLVRGVVSMGVGIVVLPAVGLDAAALVAAVVLLAGQGVVHALGDVVERASARHRLAPAVSALLALALAWVGFVVTTANAVYATTRLSSADPELATSRAFDLLVSADAGPIALAALPFALGPALLVWARRAGRSNARAVVPFAVPALALIVIVRALGDDDVSWLLAAVGVILGALVAGAAGVAGALAADGVAARRRGPRPTSGLRLDARTLLRLAVFVPLGVWAMDRFGSGAILAIIAIPYAIGLPTLRRRLLAALPPAASHAPVADSEPWSFPDARDERVAGLERAGFRRARDVLAFGSAALQLRMRFLLREDGASRSSSPRPRPRP